MRGVEDVAIAFDAAARDAKIPYAFVGGLSVMAWGQPRGTADVDALVEIAPPSVDLFVATLGRRGFSVSAADILDSLRDGAHVTVHDDGSDFHVDMKIATDGAEREEIASAHEVSFRGARLRIVAPEDTIAFKLKFGSPQDLQDARSILIRQEGRLDMDRLRALVRRLDVERALDDLMRL